MNHTYRLVWNEATQSYVPAAEGTRARKKSGGSKAIKRLCVVTALASLGTAYASSALAGPSGGEVVAGEASIVQNGATTTVSQQSQNASLNWQQFNIAAHETVQFVQPSASSVALNRVIGSEASEIYGQLRANGQVFLINPNGVLFGRTAQADAGGLVASTLNLSDADFLAGNYRFTGDMPAGIVNEGTIIAAEGGSVALLGGQVSNQGTISARLGTVALAAGSAVSLDFSGRQLMNVQVDAAALGALVQNHHLIQADGGTVIMTATARDALLSTVVNNNGVIEARTAENHEGVIKLLGSFEGGTVKVGGTLDASAPNGGDGGFIDTSGAYVKVADNARITTSAPQGSAGTWLIDPPDFTIATTGGDISGATLSANLQNGNVSILSSQGTVNVLGNGDIHVDDAISWSSGTTLTLTAVRHVNVNQAITNVGSPANGGVTLRADSAGACVVEASMCGTINFDGAGHITAATTNLYYNPTGNNDGNPSYATPTDYSANVTGTLNAFMLVNDINQLQAVNTNIAGSYALGRDIDASATSGWDGGAGFNPLRALAFDGLDHTISGLFINRMDNVGLFSATDGATIRNVGLIGGSIIGRMHVGAVVGTNNGGTLSNVFSSAQVSGEDSVGGLVGYNFGTIVDADVTGRVTGGRFVGGLVGTSTGAGTISNASASGDVSGRNDQIGGLVGRNQGSITDADATGQVTGELMVGGLVGIHVSGTIDRAFATGNVTGHQSMVGGLVGQNESTITDAYATGQVDGGDMAGGLVGFNIGVLGNTFASGAVDGGSEIGGLVGRNAGSITVAGATGQVEGVNLVGGLVGRSSGTITGGHANGRVTGGTVVGGLVGVSDGGTIRNVSAAGAVTGDSDVGGLVGRNFASILDAHATGQVEGGNTMGGLVGNNVGLSATIRNVSATGVVRGTHHLGGLVGSNGGSISDARATGQVTGQRFVGGLAGSSDGTITDAYATGQVMGDLFVGGLVGNNLRSGSISNAYASGNVSAPERVGGLAGSNAGSLTNTYATGSVDGIASVGGLAGTNGGTVVTSYATGAVRGTQTGSTGGLVGANEGSGTVTSSFWDVQTTGRAATSDGRGTGLTTAAFMTQASYGASWDFDNTWFMIEGDTRPFLRSEYSTTILNAHQLQLMQLDRSANYVLDADIDLAELTRASGLWNTSRGFVPLFQSSGFAGSFDGAGHTIAGLFINRAGSDYVGLFGMNAGTISNVGLVGGSVTGRSSTGGLAGVNNSIIGNAYTTGTVTGVSNVGGLVGDNTGTVANAYATGTVTGTTNVGGLAGDNSGTVIDVHATGQINGGQVAGGLVGLNHSIISNAYATGEVGGVAILGGLVGDNSGNITNVYATGTVGGQQVLGGLVGINHSIISNAYATGLVGGHGDVGGLIGSNAGAVTDVYATGRLVHGGVRVGGLIGSNHGIGGVVTRGYSDREVVGDGDLGGLVGLNDGGGTIVDSFWDVRLSRQADQFDGRGTGKTSAQMHQADTFSSWDISASGGSNAVWRIYEGNTGPLLRSFMTAAVVEVDDASATYNGTNQTIGINYDAGGADASLIFTGNASFRNAGSYNLSDSLYSSQQGYDISFSGGTLNIARANVSVSTIDVAKVYDGTTNASNGWATVVDGTLYDTMSGGTFAFTDKNAGTGKTVTTSGVTIQDGNGGNNYNITYVDNTNSTIDRAYIGLAATSGTKTYDGTTSSNSVVRLVQYALVAGDSLSASAAYASKDVLGTNGSMMQVANYSITDANGADVSGNYDVGLFDIPSTIDPATLTYTDIIAEDKVYDGNTAATVTLSGLTGFVGNETLGVNATGTFNSKHVASADTVWLNRIDLLDGDNGGLAGNYTLAASGTMAAARITPRSLTYTAFAMDKEYDGTTEAAVDVMTSGEVGNEFFDIVSFGTFNSKDVATANTVTVDAIYLSRGYNGAWRSNYTIAAGGTAAANITAKSLTYTTTATAKVYDGTTAASVTLTDLIGLVGDETLGVSGTGAFNSKDVATANTVTVNTATLADGSNGGLASNYSIAAGGTAAAHITPAALTIAANNQTRATNTPNPLLTATYTGFVAGETAATLGTQPTLSTAAETTSAAGSYAITASGAVDPNYTISYVPGTLTVTSTPVVTPPIVTPPIVTPPIVTPPNVPSTPLPGYLGALSYVDDIGSDARNDESRDELQLAGVPLLLEIKNHGIRLPAGVQ